MAERNYSRRSFIQAAGLAAGTLVLTPLVAQAADTSSLVEASAKGKKYRGTRDGKILESVDGGRTWTQVANFGAHCVVRMITLRRDQLQARLEVAGYGFALTSTDARLWRTV